MQVRSAIRVVPAQSVQDGAGVHIQRALGTQAIADLDPFLMLDEFKNDDPDNYMGGFPDHPHRGMETVTYMLAGAMAHHDNQGNAGKLRPGDVQWMTAGRGIIHSEMPEQEHGLMWGFQLWVNLAAANKMTKPRYQEIKATEIRSAAPAPGVTIKVIAGEIAGVSGPVSGIDVAPTYFDVSLAPKATFDHALPFDHTAFLYVFEGEVTVGADHATRAVARGNLAVLGPGDAVKVAAGAKPGRFLLLGGRPLREPVVKYGPFVMNTREQIMQAIDDFNGGRF